MSTEYEESKDQNDEESKPIKSFEDMGLKENLLRGIYNYGFEFPSKIQLNAIPVIASRRDIIAQSQSGTGKTGTFVIGMLQNINENECHPQAIIVAPTRELAEQTQNVTNELGSYMKIKTLLCIGGTTVSANIRDAMSAHVLIGTPGRINDLISRRAFDPIKLKIFIMDEADKLLEDGFVNQMREIIRYVDESTQICLFSATLCDEAMHFTKLFTKNPVNILIERENLTLDLIAQYYVDVKYEKHKLDTLKDFYTSLSIGQCIIYVNLKKSANFLMSHLSSARVIHGEMTSADRMDVMNKFRKGDCRILITTDLLARGIDVQQVSYVINYDLPNDPYTYLHRIGRSGRFKKRGVAINFLTENNYEDIKKIENHYGITIQPMPSPSEINDYLS
jgi:translation initiation factor 4A